MRGWCGFGLAALLVGLSIGAAVTDAQEAGPPSDRVVEQRLVAIEDGIPLSLSPDGRWLAVERRDREELCAYDTSTLVADACAPLPVHSIRADSIAWSPDSARLAFTEDALVRADESDIWLFDLAAESVTNLTDDGYAGTLLRLPDGTPIDLAPVWSPDGRELVFARSVKEPDGVESTALVRLAVAGGEPTELVRIADFRLAVYAGVRWLAESVTILYSIDIPGSDPADGLWAVAAEGGEPRQLLAATEHDLEAAILVDAAGGWALMRSPAPRGVSFYLLDLGSGRLTAVGRAEGAEFLPVAAALSPDGSRLLVAHGGGLVVVRNLATDGEQALLTLDQPVGTTNYSGGLSWAANDLIFGAGPAWRGVLLWLSA